MNQEKILKIILAQVVSEKSTMLSAKNQYIFKVRIDSNKREIVKSVETLFGVNVKNITTSIVKGKIKRFKGKLGNRSNWKKAIVRLVDGQIIDISNNK